VKNYQNQKGPLYDTANSLKQSIVKLFELTKLHPDKALLLFKSLFGPSSETKLAVKRN